MSSRRLMLLVALISALTLTSVLTAWAGPEKVGPLLRKYTHPGHADMLDPLRMQLADGVLDAASADQGIRCLVRGDVTRAQLEALGVTVQTRAGDVFTASVPPEAINALSDLPGMVRIQAARRLQPHLDVATLESGVTPYVHGAVSPPYPGTGNTGAGAVVGVVDSGFDYNHDDFRTATESRFFTIWDQVISGTPPAGYSYGTEWTKPSLDAETATTVDSDGHGTHVMGIAAGNGRGTGNGEPQYQYVGMAPEATMIGVKTRFYDADILDGVNYIFQQAAALGMPAVANLSLGSQYGPHDGTDPLDVGLSALTGAGKILVCSAGNERGDRIHARGQIPVSGTPSTVEFDFSLDAYSSLGGSQNDVVLFDGYYESTDNYQVTVITPNGYSLGPVNRGVFDVTNTNDGSIQIENGQATNPGGDYEVFIAFYDGLSTKPPVEGTWTIRFTRVTSTNSNIDLWKYYNGGHMSGGFATNYTDDVTIGSPGSALDAIAVAAYVSKVSWASYAGGTIGYSPPPTLWNYAPFSSRGPLRDGTPKPDISAAGMGLMSTLSGDISTSGLEQRMDPDGVHWVLEGTSMSSPATAGIVALILNRDPTFDPDQVKSRLADFARLTVFTGDPVRWEDWGAGCIAGESADMTDPVPTLTSPNGGQVWPVGSMQAITWSATDNFAVDHVDLYYSTDGGSTYPHLIAADEVNDGNFSWTVPAMPTTTARVKVVAYDRIGNPGEDVSDADFEIFEPDVTPPSVTVLIPNGGESIQESSVFEITWNASDTGANKPQGVLEAAATIAGVDSVALWYSANNGGSWTLISSGEENDGSFDWMVPAVVTDSALVRVDAWDPSENLGSDQSDGMFSITSSTGTGPGAIPAVLTLAQNRPNPLGRAGRTQITFGLTREGPVTLRVFDAAGRQVAVLAHGSYPAGFHSVDWAGRLDTGEYASSGVYFYRLETLEGVQNRKLLILK